MNNLAAEHELASEHTENNQEAEPSEHVQEVTEAAEETQQVSRVQEHPEASMSTIPALTKPYIHPVLPKEITPFAHEKVIKATSPVFTDQIAAKAKSIKKFSALKVNPNASFNDSDSFQQPDYSQPTRRKRITSPLKRDIETLKSLPRGTYIHAHELPSGSRIKVPVASEKTLQMLKDKARKEQEEQ